MWDAVAALIERATDPAALRSHRLHLLAASQGHPIAAGEPIASERRLAAAIELATPAVLARARAACDLPLVLMKGPDVARRYPAPATRPYGDIDLLTTDARAAQRALVAAGFQELGDPPLYSGIHHLRPLWLPGTPVTVELHAWPKWPSVLTPPPVAELIEAAQPGDAWPAGVLALPDEHHALVLAAHSWAHAPLACAGHLVDVAAVQAGADDRATELLARRWKCLGLWRTTQAATRELLGGRRSLAVSIWGRSLRTTRERTVVETHAERWLAPLFCAGAPWLAGARASLAAVAADLRPSPDENWRVKLDRSRLAVAHGRRARSHHVRELERRGLERR